MTTRSFQIDLDDAIWSVFDLYVKNLCKENKELNKLSLKKEKSEFALGAILFSFILENYEVILEHNKSEGVKLYENIKRIAEKNELHAEDFGASFQQPESSLDQSETEGLYPGGSGTTGILGDPTK